MLFNRSFARLKGFTCVWISGFIMITDLGRIVVIVGDGIVDDNDEDADDDDEVCTDVGKVSCIGAIVIEFVLSSLFALLAPREYSKFGLLLV